MVGLHSGAMALLLVLVVLLEVRASFLSLSSSSSCLSFGPCPRTKSPLMNKVQPEKRTSIALEEEEEEYSMTPKEFNMDLQDLAFADPQAAQDALDRMERMHNGPLLLDKAIQPDAACYTTVIEGWITNTLVDATKAVLRAQDLLDRMERLHDATKDASIRPNVVTYQLVCQGWAEIHPNVTVQTAQRAECLLDRMQQRGIQPDTIMYTTVLKGWVRRATRGIQGAMDRAEAILARIEQDNKTGCHTVRPSIYLYTTILAGWAKSRERRMAYRAERVLNRMVEPDLVAYTSVLSAWSQTKNERERKLAASHATTLLHEMEHKYLHLNQSFVKPSLVSYATAISAIGNSLHPHATQLAEQTLRHMHNVSSVIPGIQPTTMIYNTVVAAFAVRRSNSLERAVRANELVEEMVGEHCRPNRQTYKSLVHVWAKCEDLVRAAEECDWALTQMEGLHHEDHAIPPPNAVCYSVVMRTWIDSKRPDALKKVEELLSRMEELYVETKNEKIKPNAITYVTLLNALIRNGQAAGLSQRLVDRMIKSYAEGVGHKPNGMVFNTLVHAWSQSREPGAAHKAEQVMQWMDSQYHASGLEDIRPCEVTFCSVLNAWANNPQNGGVHRAQQLLDHLESLPAQERGFQPTAYSYNVVIKAWGRSDEPDAIDRIVSLIKRMKASQDKSQQPNDMTYSSAINCCAHYTGNDTTRVLGLACWVLASSRNPNHISFGSMFRAISNLHRSDNAEYPSRDELARNVWERCTRAGCVHGFVLYQLRFAMSRSAFQRHVLEPIGIQTLASKTKIRTILETMPSSWGRNAPYK